MVPLGMISCWDQALAIRQLRAGAQGLRAVTSAAPAGEGRGRSRDWDPDSEHTEKALHKRVSGV